MVIPISIKIPAYNKVNWWPPKIVPITIHHFQYAKRPALDIINHIGEYNGDETGGTLDFIVECPCYVAVVAFSKITEESDLRCQYYFRINKDGTYYQLEYQQGKQEYHQWLAKYDKPCKHCGKQFRTKDSRRLYCGAYGCNRRNHYRKSKILELF